MSTSPGAYAAPIREYDDLAQGTLPVLSEGANADELKNPALFDKHVPLTKQDTPVDEKPEVQDYGYAGEKENSKEEFIVGDGAEDDTVASDGRSPHPEVRAVVPETDDPDMPVNTFRMWFLSLVFVLVGSGVNQLFSLRYPGVHIVALVAELLAYPFGSFIARVLPVCALNPDRKFNIKEHGLIVIAANVSFGLSASADATNLIQSARMYKLKFPAGESVLCVLCCQMLGYGLAGLGIPYLVHPSYMVWPANLSNIALLTSLHTRVKEPAPFNWRMTRLRFFGYAFLAAFIWYWFPGLIFTGLSYFSWVCWIAPKNKAVNLVFGEVTGMGLLGLPFLGTWDWSMIAYNTNPLLSPHWAAANVFIGFVIFFWVVCPILYVKNIWNTGYLPFASDQVYDRYGEVYDASRILSGTSLDVEKYKAYSPAYLPSTFALVYGLSFASLTCVLVHVALWHYHDIIDGYRGTGEEDVHARLNKSYKQVPWWWWATTLIITAALSIVFIEIYHTDLPVWGLLLAFVISAIFFIPCGIILGVTNVNASQLNVLSEFVGGYLFEGKPIANITFKLFSSDVVGQAQYFAQDQKLGHYLHIPPRAVFLIQGLATILGALTQAGVTIWMLGHVKGVCEPDQPNGFVCPNGQTVMSSSVIWGLIGPARLYSSGKLYAGLLHFFWIGAITPVITWALYKVTNWKVMKYINWPLFWVGTYNVPPATGINYSSWYVTNLICVKWLFKHYHGWMYALAAALDSGLAISGIVIFFCVTYGPGVNFPSWWGNDVWQNTYDNNGTSWLDIPAVGYFGPPNGTWS